MTLHTPTAARSAQPGGPFWLGSLMIVVDRGTSLFSRARGGGGGGGSEGGGKGGWLGPPRLRGSPYGPRQRRAENF